MSTPPGLRPLLGDAHGHYKIALVGNSGVGKTTLANELSTILNIPALTLDTVHWQPGWVEAPNDEFRARVRAFLESHPEGWIVDGNYTSHLGPIVQDGATDVLWLDPPLVLNFWRILKRTFSRIFGGPTCAPGCAESFTGAFASKDSILLWCLTHHQSQRTRNIPKWEKECAEKGEGRWRRFSGWGSDLDKWLQWLRESIKST